MKNTNKDLKPTQQETIREIHRIRNSRDSVSDSSAIELAEQLKGFDSYSLGLVIAELDTETVELNKYLLKWKQLTKKKAEA